MCSFPYSDVISMKIRWKNEDNHVILLMDYWLRTNLDGTCIIAYWIKYFSFFVSEKYIDRFVLILFIIYLFFSNKKLFFTFYLFRHDIDFLNQNFIGLKTFRFLDILLFKSRHCLL